MQEVFIIGAGGFGREVHGWMDDALEFGNGRVFGGFLDDDLKALDGFEMPKGVVGTLSDYQPRANHALICGIGRVDLKRAICEPLVEAGVEFLQVIHPSAIIGRGVKLGMGVVICPRVTLTCDIELGAMAMINCHSSAGHDVKIGAWSTVSAHCDLTGNVSVHEGAFLGSGARVIPGKEIGAGAVVGAGSVVIRDVAPGASVFGNPARPF